MLNHHMRITRTNSICSNSKTPLMSWESSTCCCCCWWWRYRSVDSMSTCSKAAWFVAVGGRVDTSISAVVQLGTQPTDMMAASVVESEISCRKTSLAYYSSSTPADWLPGHPPTRSNLTDRRPHKTSVARLQSSARLHVQQTFADIVYGSQNSELT